MYFKRHIDYELEEWKALSNPKPLLIRGARQVGKTRSIRNLGEQFSEFIEINFEANKQIHSIFQGNLSADEILENIAVISRKTIENGKTLLFFDEIQACIPAIQALRYLYEQRPGLHIVAAGSLLEFALSEIPSFGVGRIRSLFMYPFSFDEFLLAFGEDKLVTIKRKASPQNPLLLPVHAKLIQYLKKFLILGGMPEVVAKYAVTKDMTTSYRAINDLKNSYYDDFAKYKKIVPVKRIRDVFNAVVMQTGSKFVYSKTGSRDSHQQIKEALELLILAGVVVPVVHTSANGLPLGAEVNHKRRKMMLIDTGLFLNILNLDISKILTTDDFNTINKGRLTEMFVGLEMIKYNSPYNRNPLYYWHREARNSNAEVDYLAVIDNKIVPVEVKSGTKGGMQSMNLFIKNKNSEKGIRISGENFSKYNNIEVFPLYAVGNIVK